MKALIISVALVLTACGSNPTKPNQSIPICAAPMLPTFVGSTQWLYFNGSTYTPYQGGCEPGR